MRRIAPLVRLASASDAVELGDGELLSRFASDRDDAAFAELVRRHGPMVLGVCLRLTRHRQDAEDAFQAAFLVLARRAASLARPERLVGWLHGVATRTALEARRRRARSSHHEREASAVPDSESPPPRDHGPDLHSVLDESLGRLPEKYRTAVVLCDIEGLTREQAAARLGVPVGTLSGRLTTAHRKLAVELERRGFAPASVLVATLAASELTPTVSASASAAAVRAGLGVVVKGLEASGASPAAQAIAKAILASGSSGKWKLVCLVILAGAAMTTGIGLAVQPPPPEDVTVARPTRSEPPVIRVKPMRSEPIANDLNDIFVVSDVAETVPEFFRHNRTMVAPMSAAKYRELTASHEPYVEVSLPINAVNDPKRTVKGGRTVAIVPPSDAVRRLIDPIAADRATLHAVIRREGTAGLYDLVGYTNRSVSDAFFERPDAIVRDGRVRQSDLLYTEPAAGPSGPIPARPANGQALRVISNGIKARPGVADVRVLTDRDETVADYFCRNRVAVGSLLVSDYERLARTAEPWMEVPVYPVSFNDDTPAEKSADRRLRLAPPTAAVEARLFRPSIRPRPDIDAFTVVMRRDRPDGVFHLVGFCTSRTAFQFFEKSVSCGSATELLQRDLRFRESPPLLQRSVHSR